MTEDPVKLYVVVMTILLGVLGFVAYTSYEEAQAYEAAVERAPSEARKLTELSNEVQQLCDQLRESKMRGAGPRTLVENTARRFEIQHSNLKASTERIGRGIKGKEKRVKFDFGSGRKSPPQTRKRIAQFCQAVERDSSGILRTVEIHIRRKTGQGLPAAGEAEKVVDDTYSGTIIFGTRVVE